jgi:hypothetical protein
VCISWSRMKSPKGGEGLAGSRTAYSICLMDKQSHAGSTAPNDPHTATQQLSIGGGKLIDGNTITEVKGRVSQVCGFFILVAMYVCMVLFSEEYPCLNDFLTQKYTNF